MDSDVVVLVPRRAEPWRDALWANVRPSWAQWGPVVEGWHTADEGPFSRAVAMNRAAAEAGPWEVAVLIDADVVPAHPEQVAEAIDVARLGVPALAYDKRLHVGRATTARWLRTGERPAAGRVVERSCSSAVVVRRDLWDTVGGMDERFVGWGYEDVAFRLALETMAGMPMHRAGGLLYHLWHPRAPEAHRASHPLVAANRHHHDTYLQALGDRERMAEVLAR